MKLNRLASICLVASALVLNPNVTIAQGKPDAAKKGDKKDDKKGDKKDDKKAAGDKETPKEIELDEEPADEGPVTAGQMTEQAAQAKRLFDGEKWSEAAARALSRLQGRDRRRRGQQAARAVPPRDRALSPQVLPGRYGIFSEIADKPNHLKFNETLLWLSKLATELPEPADIVERVGKYNDEQIARFNNPNQRDLYWQLNYLLGRYKYRNRQYEEALRLFEKVDTRSRSTTSRRSSSRGISNVQLRKSVPAVQSLPAHRPGAIDEGVEGVEDEARMRDLAFLSMARTYYSASVRLDDNNVPTIDTAKLSAAVKYWNTRRRRAASTGSTASSRSRGPTSWPATTRTRSATSTRSRRRTSRTRSTRKPTSSRRSSTSRSASTRTRPPSSRSMQKKYEPIKKELEARS